MGAIAALLWAFASSPTPAAGGPAILGVGTWQCSRFLADVGNTTQVAAFSWFVGYLAGVNAVIAAERGAYYDIGPRDDVSILAGLMRYCAEHPENALAAGADALLLTLPIGRLR
jgi:hypothetical protein